MGSPFDILSNTSESAALLAGVNPDTSVRFTGDELLTLCSNLQPHFGEDTVCIIGQCLGGALERGETQGSGLTDELFSYFQSDDLTAQHYCKTDLTFDVALGRVREKFPALAEFILAKRATVKQATTAHYDEQRSQDTSKVIQAGADAGKKLADTVSGVLDIAPATLAVAVVVVAAIAALYVLNMSKKAGV